MSNPDKKNTASHIPALLIWLRLIIGFTMIIVSISNIQYYKPIAIILLVMGLLTDIFDGIIARTLQVSTQKLRRLDSTVDQIFFISAGVATYIQCPDFFASNVMELIIILGLEAATYLICFLKFRKEIATHTIGAKVWTLLLCATLIELILHCQSMVLFHFFFWVGVLTRVEIISIVLILKKWTNDVPSVYHAMKLRKDKEIKRSKLFNG